MRATRAVIHLGNLTHNINAIKKLINPGVKICAAVKANSYGHGAVECSRRLVAEGVDVLAVATVSEGEELRAAGINCPILLLSLCAPEEAEQAVANDITALVFDEEYIDMLSKAAAKLGKTAYTVHIAIDSGMGRIGCLPEQAGKIARAIKDSGNLSIGGTCTHFAMSDVVSQEAKEYTNLQYKRFLEAVDNIKKEGLNPGLRHCCASAASLVHPEMQLDMVRPGIILYGYYADDVDRDYLEKQGRALDLKPVMTLETEVSAIRHFSKGMSVSYGRTWIASENTDIAVLPIGYGDGLLRRWASQGLEVSIGGKRYPVRGRVCMDQCMIELGTNSPVRRWDRAVIFGSQEDGACQDADSIARATGTISYEITSCITRRVPRIYVE
ncbi:MAG: alanine racemase [Treponema sp.]|nr:alanine racemase [Treponema sp.]